MSTLVSDPYRQRQQAYLEAEIAASHPAPGRGVSEIFTQIPRLALGRGALDESQIAASLDLIASRRDCADFALAGILRILYRFDGSPLLTPELKNRLEQAALNFCYWYDQPGVRGMCFHTENHQILFHSCELLAGQRFPERIFPNAGFSGALHRAHGEELTHRWIDQRARFGFAEWLSNGYFDEDLLALLNLYDFAADPAIRRKAGMLIDLLLLEIALHQHQGVLACTHGRTYVPFLLDGSHAPTTAIAWMVFGLGTPVHRTNFTLAALCTSAYRCPEVIQQIAHASPAELTLIERHGLNVADAARYGLHPDRLEDNLFFWACQTARHPLVRPTSLALAQISGDPWLVDFVTGVDAPLPACQALIESAGAVFDGDAVNTALSEVNLLTFRTPDYILSTAQDFRPGKPGYQQHIWQAALSPQAVVFTTHPGTDDFQADHLSRPNFWAGNRWLPRAAQHRNVTICIHHVPPSDPRPYAHAYFPRAAFDEVAEGSGWVCARQGSGYLALYAQPAARWNSAVELRADAPDSIWICEMGSAAQNGSFAAFCAAIQAAEVEVSGLQVRYSSPALGEVCFGWNEPLTVAGKAVALHGYPRFANPYVQAELGARRYTIYAGGEQLVLDFEM